MHGCQPLLTTPPPIVAMGSRNLSVEYPSESAPSLSGKDGSEFPAPFLNGHCFRDLPLGCEVGILREGPTTSSVCPICTALGGALPTNCGMESDSLDSPWSTGWSCCLTLDLGHHLSDTAIAHHRISLQLKSFHTLDFL